MAIKPLVKPRFATSDLNNGPLGGPNVLEPSEAKKDSGWNSGEKPPREYFNWLHRLTYQWIDWLEETASNALLKSNNLSDLSSASTARTNLGLGTAATVNTGTGAANVPTITQADARYLKQSSNLSDLASASTARTNLGLGTASTRNVGTTASDLPDITAADGRYVKQVTPATETQVGVLEVATAAEAQLYAADDKILTPLKLSSAFNGNASYASNGYQKLPGGLILQWGTRTMTVGDVDIFSFPIPFPNTVLNVNATVSRISTADGGNLLNTYATPVSTSQLRLVFDDVTSSGISQSIQWFAIGY